jgi:ribonuclease HII
MTRERGKAPTLGEEQRLLRSGCRSVVGMDEVGRGALAGPVSVGAVLVDDRTGPVPTGVRDSKALTPRARAVLVPEIERWSLAHAVGHAAPEEIDEIGIIAALRLAGRRALALLPVACECVLLDGAHDWLTGHPVDDLFGSAEGVPSVVTMVKADSRCAAVAAASVLAKVERDALMVELSGRYPAFHWDRNKGHASPRHVEAWREHGPCPQHRHSWHLPTR